jgi:hypothetical protein
MSEGASLWDWFKDVALPLLTFVAGYFLSTWDRTRESRRQVKNMRTILFKELEDNYGRIDSLWPPSNDLSEIAGNWRRIDILARRSQEFSTAVYSEYLGRMDALKAEELDRVFDAYHLMQQARDAGANLLTVVSGPPESRNQERDASLASAFLFTIDAALDKMSAALDVFSDYQKEAKELKSRRGSEVQRYDEMVEAIERSMAEKKSAQEESRP